MTPPVPSPAAAAAALSVLCGFLLKVTVGYVFCVAIARFATTAAVRFCVWLAFLLTSATYWLFCLARIATGLPVPRISTQAPAQLHAALPVMLSVDAAGTLGQALRFALLAYLGGLLLMLLIGSWKRLQLSRALRHRVAPPPAVHELFRSLSDELQAPPCDLWLLTGLTSPASLGWARPSIYLPVEVLETNPGLRDVLCHELSHIRRRDGLWDLVMRLCRSSVFFHPFVHKALSALRLERELACDSLVVKRNPGTRDLYADTLVRFGWKTSLAVRPDRIGIGFTSQAVVLNARVRSILAGERVHSRWSSGMRALLGTAACWAFAAIAPALWVGFGLTTAATPVIASVTRNPPAAKPVHRRTVSASRPVDAPHPDPDVAAIFSPDPPPGPTHHDLQNAGFHPQNMEEPMSNPPRRVDTSQASGAGTFGRGTPGQPALPSAGSIVVDSATELLRLGSGRDRDHDHD